MIKSNTWSVYNTRKEERQTVTFENAVTEEEAKKELNDFFHLLGVPVFPDNVKHLTDWKPE